MLPTQALQTLDGKTDGVCPSTVTAFFRKITADKNGELLTELEDPVFGGERVAVDRCRSRLGLPRVCNQASRALRLMSASAPAPSRPSAITEGSGRGTH